ncbi:Hypothetical protein PMT_2411 [Prochlorococcus marinus str. MIT 9313]|uniref:Uncharacterized protein n=1 Tax=Prochlorococcus marinus (strain MIT 9313) TaxID=74547 RepID=B9ERQ1_PROMM|nr:Hypothetical protein PMT_2411 [Prochlorococcus marinus str. MIT 9313]
MPIKNPCSAQTWNNQGSIAAFDWNSEFDSEFCLQLFLIFNQLRRPLYRLVQS